MLLRAERDGVEMQPVAAAAQAAALVRAEAYSMLEPRLRQAYPGCLVPMPILAWQMLATAAAAAQAGTPATAQAAMEREEALLAER
jgi:hypothetical protein